MEIHVIDNAINSLEVGLEFYNKFLDNLDNLDISVSHFGNLKFAVISFHNAVELLTKGVLLDVNEFLVFKADIENDDSLCEMLQKQFLKKKRKANIAYHAVFSQNHYKTIEYGKSIILLHKIFKNEISKRDYEVLDLLAEYRNSLTHLGYASTYEWYKILVVLNKSLELIKGFYINSIIRSEEYFTDEIIQNIEKTLKKSKESIPDIWMASHEYILEDINNKLDLYFENNLVNINDIVQNREYDFYEKIKFSFKNKDNTINLVWDFIYSYLNESIIIVDDSKRIIGYISLEDWNLTFLYDENGIPNYLDKVGIFIPKEKLYFDENRIYDISNKSKNNLLYIKSGECVILINKYLKNRVK